MITVTMTKLYNMEELHEYTLNRAYGNDIYGAIRQMIFSDMLNNQIEFKITINNEEENNEETS